MLYTKSLKPSFHVVGKQVRFTRQPESPGLLGEIDNYDNMSAFKIPHSLRAQKQTTRNCSSVQQGLAWYVLRK